MHRAFTSTNSLLSLSSDEPDLRGEKKAELLAALASYSAAVSDAISLVSSPPRDVDSKLVWDRGLGPGTVKFR